MNEVEWVKFQEEQYANTRSGDSSSAPTILEMVGEGKFVLDCGIHGGGVTNEIAKKNRVIGTDLLKVVEKFRGQYSFEYVACNACDLLFKDDVFDVVVAGDLIEHFMNPQRFLSEARRVLKKGGKLVIATPNGEHKAVTHCRFYTEETLRKELSELFTIERIVVNNALIALAEVKR